MYTPPLEKVKAAAHCKAEWCEMYGNDRVRFCSQCNQHVYSLSALPRKEAEDLIMRTEGRLPARFYKRKDGTILTTDCPVGSRALKGRAHRVKTHVLGALLSLFGLLCVIDVDRLTSWKRGMRDPLDEVVMGVLGYTVTEPREERYIRSITRHIVVARSPSESGPQSITGDAVVEVLISPIGKVERARFIKGNPLLKEVAERAALMWEFEPMLSNGRPTEISSVLTFHVEHKFAE